MVTRLYLDGCSLTYGQGLPRDKSLGNLFSTVGGYNVKDQSRPGKSNLAIATDAYKHWQDYDTFVLGFTFSSRFGIKYQDENLDFFAGFHGQGLALNNHNTSAQQISDAYMKIYKYFMTVFGPPYCDDLSNMIADSLISFLISQNKKVLAFSWESRSIQNKIHYPYLGPELRLEDGHLNEKGTYFLFDYLQNILDE